jgi:hypothetical protein
VYGSSSYSSSSGRGPIGPGEETVLTIGLFGLESGEGIMGGEDEDGSEDVCALERFGVTGTTLEVV